MNIIQRIFEQRKPIRVSLYTLFTGSVILPLGQVVASNGRVTLYLAVCLNAALLVGSFEVIVYAEGRRRRGRIIFAGSQHEAIARLGDFSAAIRGAKTIDLLSDTFKSFTDHSEYLAALRDAMSAGAAIRLLVMDPVGYGVKGLVMTRNAAGRGITELELKQEIDTSIRRLSEAIGPKVLTQVLRLYKTTPTIACYRLDRLHLITAFLFGHGASSPALVFELTDSSQNFCASLGGGFAEMWDAANPATTIAT